jgi:predicted Zn-dependent peptidase
MKSVFSLLLAVLSIFSVQAQDVVVGLSSATTAKWEVISYGNDPLKVRQYTFANGLTLITSTQKKSPRIYTMVAVRTGSKNDPAEHTGLAHYLEHMLFKGTDKYGSLDWSKEAPLLKQIDQLYEKYNHSTDPIARKVIYRAIDSVSQLAAKFAIANEYDKMCQAIGAQGTNAFTSNDETVYINDIPSNMVNKWIALEAERFRNPVLRLFHTELEAVYEEKNISLDRVGDKVYEVMMADLFKKHNYGLQTTIGTVEHLKNPSLEAIRNYYNDYYVPNNMAIIMSGDFDPDAVAEQVAEKFGYMQRKDVYNYVFELETPLNQERKYELVDPEAEYVNIGFRIPNAGTEESRAAKLIDLLLSNSKAGLIDVNLVLQQKVLSAYSGVEQLSDYGIFYLQGSPKEGQTLEEVKELLLGELEKIRKGEFDANLLKAIILNKEIEKIRAFDENESRCFLLKDAFIQGLDYRDKFNEIAMMKEMSKDYLVDFANVFLNMDRVVVYKRKGEKPVSEKIEKPEIHPVELNRDKQSAFVKNWLALPSEKIQPEVVDLNAAISREYVGPAVMRYVQNKDNRLFNLSYRYDYGTWHNKALELIPSYISYVGTDGYSAADISQAFYRWGCSFGANAGTEHFVINVNGPEENFDSAVWLLDKLINNPKVDEAVFASMVADIVKSRNDAKSNPVEIRSAIMSYCKFGPNNPSKWVLSNAELQKMKAEDVVKLVKGMKNIKHTLDYYGARDQAAVAASLRKYHQLPEDQTKHELAFQLDKSKSVSQLFVEREVKEPVVYFVHYDQVQASINWYSRGSVLSEAETPMVSAFNQYFGGDMSSVVFQNIREAKALAYSTFAIYRAGTAKGKYNSMVGFVGTQADKFHDAVGAMNELLTTLPQNADVFELAKKSLANQVETNRLDRSGYIAAFDANADRGFGQVVPNLENYNKLSTLGMVDIANFHKEKVSGKPYAMVVVADRNRVTKADLGRYGKVIEVMVDELFGY